jgi:hypothetical protein
LELAIKRVKSRDESLGRLSSCVDRRGAWEGWLVVFDKYLKTLEMVL